MEKMYVALEDLWPYVQSEYKRAEARHDLDRMQCCNWFLQLICSADHKKVSKED